MRHDETENTREAVLAVYQTGADYFTAAKRLRLSHATVRKYYRLFHNGMSCGGRGNAKSSKQFTALHGVFDQRRSLTPNAYPDVAAKLRAGRA